MVMPKQNLQLEKPVLMYLTSNYDIISFRRSLFKLR